MAKSPSDTAPGQAERRAAARAERQAAALRQNLRRRKAGPATAGDAESPARTVPPPSSGPLPGDNSAG